MNRYDALLAQNEALEAECLREKALKNKYAKQLMRANSLLVSLHKTLNHFSVRAGCGFWEIRCERCGKLSVSAGEAYRHEDWHNVHTKVMPNSLQRRVVAQGFIADKKGYNNCNIELL